MSPSVISPGPTARTRAQVSCPYTRVAPRRATHRIRHSAHSGENWAEERHEERRASSANAQNHNLTNSQAWSVKSSPPSNNPPAPRTLDPIVKTGRPFPWIAGHVPLLDSCEPFFLTNRTFT